MSLNITTLALVDRSFWAECHRQVGEHTKYRDRRVERHVGLEHYLGIWQHFFPLTSHSFHKITRQ